MKLARKLNGAARLVLIACIFLSAAAPRLCGQDVLAANPDLWGVDAFKSSSSAAPTQNQNAAPLQGPRSEATGAGGAQAERLPAPAVNVSDMIRAARQYEKRNDLGAAKTLYEEVLRIEPTSRSGLLSYARMLHRAGDLDASISMYYRSLEHHRDDAVAMNDLALCYARMGELRHALAMMQGAISANPSSSRYQNNIAKLLLEMGQPQEAFSHLVSAGGPVVGHYNMAKLLGQRGRQTEAVQFLEMAVQMDPAFAPATQLLAQIREQSPALAGESSPLAAQSAASQSAGGPRTESRSNRVSTSATTAGSISRLPTVHSTAKGSSPGLPLQDRTAVHSGTAGANSAAASQATASDGMRDLAAAFEAGIGRPESGSGTSSKGVGSMNATASNSDAMESVADRRAAIGSGDSKWTPGSIRLQSAEFSELDPLSSVDAMERRDGPQSKARDSEFLDWAVAMEDVELSPTDAPAPFDSPTQPKRYTEVDAVDPVSQFLRQF